MRNVDTTLLRKHWRMPLNHRESQILTKALLLPTLLPHDFSEGCDPPMPVIVAFESAPWGPRRMGTGRGAGLGSSVHPGLGDWSTDGDPATTGSVKAVLREPLPSKQI